MAMTLEQQRAIAVAKAKLRLKQSASPENMAWTDVGISALQNTPASAKKFVTDMVQPFLNPIDTANSVLDLAAGGISRGIEAVAGDQSWLPENQATATADAVGEFYKDRYGSVGGFKKALAEDPVGVLADASTVLTGGAGLTVRAPGAVGKVGRVLDTAARATNPLIVPEKALKATGKALGGTAKTVLGATTGTSGETISEAYQAGRKGGEASRVFRDNLRGKVDQADVIDEAKTALGNIAEKRDRQYQTDMRGIKADKTPLDMAPVERTFQDLVDSMYYEGHAAVSNKTISKLKEIGEVIDEWSLDPKMQNAIGFDILKRRIDDLMPVIGDTNKTAQAERAVTQMRNAVKKVIVDRFPQYKSAMENYEKSKNLQREIQTTLALGKKNTADQTLRRMQSLTRNNVNTNYGARLNSAKELEAAGAPNLMPALAGQAMSAKMPRGLLGPMLTGGGLALGAYLNPAFLAALPAFSPRLVGEATRGAGALARGLDAIPKPTMEQLLLMRQLGIVGPLAPPLQE
jgi:hypothetical protein